MATFTHYYPETGNLSFSIEFDECEVTSEFSEMVYGAIDNCNRTEEARGRKECKISLAPDY